jgi:hypothetical protein
MNFSARQKISTAVTRGGSGGVAFQAIRLELNFFHPADFP